MKHKPFLECPIPVDDPADALYDLWRDGFNDVSVDAYADLGDTVYDMDRDGE